MTTIEEVEELDRKLRIASNKYRKKQRRYLLERDWDVQMEIFFGVRMYTCSKGDHLQLDEDHAMEIEQGDT